MLGFSGIASSIHSNQYRADVDGLRAVAVLSVVICHRLPNLLPGGFIGVDIFFVIWIFDLEDSHKRSRKSSMFVTQILRPPNTENISGADRDFPVHDFAWMASTISQRIPRSLPPRRGIDTVSAKLPALE
jgi:hypothetical protein